ncbi:transcription factor bHLH91-like [Lycium barbarum]|uniref:transcription factor bHLH91-like n=1 Tax=Lycium barbarum TaxID=112863 RepID=UPI00293E7A8D|nr:transcription factor bHLH91-like [Lycium barbarum]
MYAESLSFDPTSHQDEGLDKEGLLHHATSYGTNFSMGLQQQMNLEIGKFHSTLNCNNDQSTENNLNMQEFGQPSWGEMGFNPYNQQQLSYPISSLISNPSNFISNTDLQKSSNFLSTPSLGLLASTSTNLFYDPQLMNMPMNPCTPQQQQPSLFKELFHLSPHGLGSWGTGSLFSHGHGVVEEEVTGGTFYHDGSFLSGDINSEAIKKKEGKDIKHHASEKQRRVHFSDKFQALRTLIPNPSKNDRATIIADAIGYINELKMRLHELKNQVDWKKERIKKQRIVKDDGAVIEAENYANKSCNGKSSWHQRKSKNSEVDVRVVEDEVTVKLVQHDQHKRTNCLLFVSKAFDELKLDVHHVAGGLFGDHYSYLFNSKICEGSTVYASAIADKVIEVLDKEHATFN